MGGECEGAVGWAAAVGEVGARGGHAHVGCEDARCTHMWQVEREWPRLICEAVQLGLHARDGLKKVLSSADEQWRQAVEEEKEETAKTGNAACSIVHISLILLKGIAHLSLIHRYSSPFARSVWRLATAEGQGAGADQVPARGLPLIEREKSNPS